MRLSQYPILRSIGWATAAQVVNRVFRLMTTIVVARVLLPEDYGLAALIFSIHDFIFLFIRRGTQSKLIQVDHDSLATLSQTAYTINWLICFAAACIQTIAAFGMSQIYANPDLLYPTITMALTYLLLPFAMVQTAHNLRDCKMKIIAQIETWQSIGETLMTIAMALAGFGVWSLVIPKILVVPIWMLIQRHHAHWRPTQWISFNGWKTLFSYSSRVLLVDLLQVVRNNIDYILIGYFLGIEVLGIYYFAFNAGLGISTSLLNGVSNVLLPHFCNQQDGRKSFQQGTQITLLLISMIAITQAVSAHLYVPFVFGEHWQQQGAVPILIILCLSAIPRALGECTSQYLRSIDQTGLDLKLNAGFTLVFVCSVFISATHSIHAVALTILISHWVGIPIIYWLSVKLSCQNQTRLGELQYGSQN